MVLKRYMASRTLEGILSKFKTKDGAMNFIRDISEKRKLPKKFVDLAVDYFKIKNPENAGSLLKNSKRSKEAEEIYFAFIDSLVLHNKKWDAAIIAHKNGLYEKERTLWEELGMFEYAARSANKNKDFFSVRRIIKQCIRKKDIHSARIISRDNDVFDLSGFIKESVGDFSEAADMYKKANLPMRAINCLLKNPEDVQSKYAAAELAEKKDLFEIAINIYKSMEVIPYVNLARIFEKTNKIELAVDNYIKSGWFNEAARLEKVRGNIDEAVKLYVKDKDYGSAARVLIQTNKKYEANKYFRKEILKLVKHKKYFDAGKVAHEIGMKRELKKYFNLAIESAEKYGDFKNAYEICLYFNFDEKAKHYKKIMNLLNS